MQKEELSFYMEEKIRKIIREELEKFLLEEGLGTGFICDEDCPCNQFEEEIENDCEDCKPAVTLEDVMKKLVELEKKIDSIPASHIHVIEDSRMPSPTWQILPYTPVVPSGYQVWL